MKNKHKTLIAAAAMQGIMLGFWSAGWLCWVCENVGLSPDFLMLLAAALIFCLIFEIDLQLSAGKTEAAESMFFYVLVLGILVLAVGYAVSIWRLKRLPLFFTGLVLAMSLLLNRFPDIRIMVMTTVFCGGLTGFLSASVSGRSRIFNAKAMKNGLFALVLMAVIFGSSYYIADNFAAEYMRSHYEAVKKYPRKMMAASEKVLSVFLGDREWQVSNHSPVQSGRTKLKIWTDKKPEAAIYLKGFVGDGFNTQTEQWNVITDNSLQNEYQNWTVSGSLSYDEAKALWAKQLYDCLDRLSDETGTVNYIISNVSAGKTCTWAPYGIDTDGIEMEGDSYLKSSSNRDFQGYPLTDNDALLSNADVSDIFSGDGAELFDSYNRYVQANYLNVPDGLPSLEAAVQVIQDENGDLSVSQWVAQIQNILWETCTYQKDNLESVPDGSNVIEDFFGRQRKGYCTHFASAGVMMLRMAGIPARYVTGYVIWPDDFKADSASDGYMADVTGYRGHAWVEVYNAAQGIWVPVDMTPADSVQTSNYLPTQENSGHSESTDNVSNHYTDSTETISDTGDTGNHTESTEIVSESRDDNDRTEETKTGVNTDISRTNQGISAAVKIVLGMALMIVIAGLGVYVYRRRQNQPRHYSRVNRNKALLAMWAHLTDELDRSGIRTDKGMDDWDYIKWLQSRVQTVKPEELTFLMEKLYQAAFGEDMLSEKTYEQCVQICCRIQREIKKK